jgi:tetratricopeptide (TPR) repeat protein
MDLEPELVPTGLKLLRWIGSPPADWARWVPETLEAKRHLIIALSDSGHQNDAIQLLESTVRSTADKRFLFEAARRAFEWNAPGLALEAAQRWLEEELRSKKAGPDLAQATLMVARAHLELGEPEPAYRVFRDVLKEMERDSDASRNASLELLTSMGYLYLKAGQTVMAQSLFLKATNVAPHDTAALLGLARTYRRAGNEADAIRCYREILRLRPDDTEIEQELRDLLAARSVADGRQ